MAEHPIGDMMGMVMEKVRTMVDANSVVGEPIVTPDGVTLIPVTRVSFGLASGGGDKSAASKGGVWGGSGAAVKADPIGFLMIREGTARMVSIQLPAHSTADRIIDMVPEILEKVEGLVDKYAPKEKTAEEPPV